MQTVVHAQPRDLPGAKAQETCSCRHCSALVLQRPLCVHLPQTWPWCQRSASPCAKCQHTRMDVLSLRCQERDSRAGKGHCDTKWPGKSAQRRQHLNRTRNSQERRWGRGEGGGRKEEELVQALSWGSSWVPEASGCRRWWGRHECKNERGDGKGGRGPTSEALGQAKDAGVFSACSRKQMEALKQDMPWLTAYPQGCRDARMEEATLKKDKTKGGQTGKPPPLPRGESAWDLGGANRDGEGQTALTADTGQNSETGMRNLSEKKQ